MEKRLYKLRIDPEFHDLIPPLSEEEYKMLEESIVRDGCDTPLVVWKGTIVDGHNRYEICHKHAIPFAVEEKDFEDKDAAKCWMLERQLARRNLNSFQRAELALKYEPLLRKIAKTRMGKRNDLIPGYEKGASSKNGYTTDCLASLAGVSRDTIRKAKILSSSADEETKQKLKKGVLSIHRAYSELTEATSLNGNPREKSGGASGENSKALYILCSDQWPTDGFQIEHAEITIVHIGEDSYEDFLQRLLEKVR
ncbi:MAG: hypothetical protein IJ708_06890 [Clostridia bacterium]|nr:hypothetical protein [Clostridia bacterium]